METVKYDALRGAARAVAIDLPEVYDGDDEDVLRKVHVVALRSVRRQPLAACVCPEEAAPVPDQQRQALPAVLAGGLGVEESVFTHLATSSVLLTLPP